MDKKRILAVGVIGLLLAAGLVVAGCGPNCPGNGECTVTIDQGPYGLYVDSDSPRSSCGKRAEWNYNTSDYSGGCKVQNNIDDIKRKFGKYGCDC